jgi:hypothetical protein
MAAAIGHRLVLQVALAALVADRAVERVVDEQELHHPFARLLDHRRVGADRLAVGGGQRADAALDLGAEMRIRPWIGQAAASPSAQMVWPSTCLVTSSSMSISRFSASPSRQRSITRHIQPVPSRHGVHWPQLSCL